MKAGKDLQLYPSHMLIVESGTFSAWNARAAPLPFFPWWRDACLNEGGHNKC
jgi:hypothetical protein